MSVSQQTARGGGRLFASTGVSLIGQGAVFAAVPLLAASLSSDPFWVSMATAATYAAWLIIGLPAGTLVDRWPLRPVMVWADLIRAVLLALLAVAVPSGAASMSVVIGVVFALSVAGCFFDPAAQAALPAVVGRNDAALAQANGRFWSLDTLGRSLLGPPLGAALFAASHMLPFALAVVTFVVSAVLLSGLPLNSEPRHAATVSVWNSTREGLTFLAREPRLRTLVAAMGAFNFGYNIAFATLVLFALERLGLSQAGYGVLLAAPALGGVLGGFLSPKLQGRINPVTAYAAAFATQGAIWALLGATESLWATFPAMVVLGLATNAVTVLGGTARQLLTPGVLLGRVSAATRVVGLGSAALGAALGGVIAHAWGLSAPLFVATTVLVVASACALHMSRGWA